MSVVLRPDHRTPIRPRSSPAVIKALAHRLTSRDRWMMRMVWHHRVLTTPQLTTLAFTSYNTAKDRLAILYELRALDRLRPWNAPWHYVLDAPGAEILAADNGLTLREFGFRSDRAQRPVKSSHLAHTLGVNQVFVDLYAHTRTPDHHAHLEWWTEGQCAWHYGDIVRPDAAGTWQVGTYYTSFFLEYDMGTERLRRLTAKLDSYSELAETTNVRGVVLFYLPSRRREAQLRRAIGSRPPVPVATAVHGAHPAYAVWARVDDPELRPRTLVDLVPKPAVEQPFLPDLPETEDG
ncbi:protein involved in plasmid replication-relaxation [Haloactinospora alba]|uniref:Protein involved in plasmid replication-relaxation n=1 Tax=Haloactinospora alba TaxID=405555 RepID=A0A543NLE8_9ACTN|nr:replication-relaxation family protein [Haloactinospora alba]TQN32650.1 protein involved in plasmid replication-relaxation [Haloactinospora alba]